jgi:two-component system, LytTR family, sensor kinase
VRLQPPTSRRSLFWLLQIGGWGLFWCGMVAAGLGHWSPGFTLLHKTSLAGFGFAATLALRAAFGGLRRSGLPHWAIAATALPLSWLFAAAWMAAHNALLARALARALRDTGFAPVPFPDFGNTVYYVFVLLAWSALYFGIPAYLDLSAERARVRRAEVLAREARLEALRLQLHPHFLFNALNSISTLIAERRTDDANRMLSRLSDFLRLTLDAPPAHTSTLADELEFCRRYLEIEAVRFGDRLEVEVDAAPEALDAEVPVLLLQPLVENAVRHAIAPRESGGRIAVAARRIAAGVEIEVEDDGAGFAASPAAPEGLGLANCRRRLDELYGGAARLELTRGRLGGARVRVVLPAASGEESVAS